MGVVGWVGGLIKIYKYRRVGVGWRVEGALRRDGGDEDDVSVQERW
jgi:hypothetical protein